MPRILQAGILEHAQPEGDVDALLHDVDLVVGEPQPDLDVGIPVPELGDAGSDQPPPQAERRRHLDGAARLAGQRGDRGFRLGDGVQHLLGPGVECRSVLGRHQLPRRAVEQPHAEILFEFLDAVRRHGRRNSHVAACRREIAEFHDPHEDGDVVEICQPDCLERIRREASIFQIFLKVIVPILSFRPAGRP